MFQRILKSVDNTFKLQKPSSSNIIKKKELNIQSSLCFAKQKTNQKAIGMEKYLI